MGKIRSIIATTLVFDKTNKTQVKRYAAFAAVKLRDLPVPPSKNWAMNSRQHLER